MMRPLITSVAILALFTAGAAHLPAEAAPPDHPGTMIAVISEDIAPYIKEGNSDNSPLIVVKSGIGPYLTDGKGMTLYHFKRDAPNRNACIGICLATWPIYYVPDIAPPAGSEPAEFGTFQRADGLMQSTFRGWPLHYFSGDKKAGDTVGHGTNRFWLAIDPLTLEPLR